MPYMASLRRVLVVEATLRVYALNRAVKRVFNVVDFFQFAVFVQPDFYHIKTGLQVILMVL